MTGGIASRARSTTADLRRRNLAAVIGLVHRRGALRRTEITEATGLNKSTVLSLVEELEALGLVTEHAAISDGSRGRPSAVVAPVARRVVAVATEIGVDHARIAVVGMGGVVYESVRVDVNPAEAGPETTSRLLGEASIDLLAERPHVVGAATAVHGLVSLDGELAAAPNLGWPPLDLRAKTDEILPRDLPVFFANEADLGALGEHRRGAAADAGDLLYLSAERGIGGGLIRGGERQTGHNGYATEVGHMIVNRGGVRCACGARGCLETEIGELALLRKAGRRRTNRRGARGVVDDAADGDPQAKAAVRDVAAWLGFGIGNIVNVLDPGTVVCGGHLAGIHRIAGDAVASGVAEVVLAGDARELEIVPSTLGADASLIGATELVFDHALRDPAALGPRARRKVSA